MPTLVVRHPDGNESEHDLSGELKIGRQEGNDLVLTAGGVSRKHARFYVEGGKVLVEDLGSANGTYVDGERVTEATVVTPQAQVVLGDYELKLKAGARAASGPRKAATRSVPPSGAPELGSEEGAPRSTKALPTVRPARPPGSALAKKERPAPGGAPAPNLGPVLRGLTGPWANKLYPIRGKLLVGRAPPAAVLLEDDSLSRKHAELERNPRGNIFLRDLGSSNGTLLNGERIGQEPVELAAGDIIQFGMVEVVFESGEEQSEGPKRRGSASTPKRSGAAAASAPAPAGGLLAQRKKLLVGVGGLVGLLLVAGIVKAATGSSGGTPAGGAGGVGSPPPKVDTSEALQELLSECRSFASMEMGNEPNWEKADAACDKALNIDPINVEANSLIKRIKVEKEASTYFFQAEKALARLKEEEALDMLQKIPKESQYFRRAKIKVRDALELVKSKALDDCKRYMRDQQWTAAVPRCDRYMGFWCQTVQREDIEPPIGFTLSLEGRLGRREWRPKDKLFVQFLQARKKLDPTSEAWKCPESEFGPDPTAIPKPEDDVKRIFRERYPNNLVYAAMLDYWGGRGNEALATLQKLRSNYELAQFHGQADDLIKKVGTVDQLFKNGEAALQLEDVERAAEPMAEALEVDKQLMGDLWERTPSFYRRNIQQDIASNAFIRGKHWADREDRRRGCKVWKLGFQFYKGNTDLNRVVGFCSTQGLRALQTAGGCSDLQAAEDFAVPGDGLAEKIVAAKEQMKCK
ncbi:FHA domain-containing protein [Hyalangium rubrum]|uniref:FHA domain-containing protein n=1 Tax=Hyalangium rubrum TaxID=3103134 RepID=A0ABU5HBL9_9BACT|nr:FHA domain-containing protein [Hyalangium sp. s54d21]MDY7230867.1 FHA domain-containing protein [Hyalangium sp. s54d21]